MSFDFTTLVAPYRMQPGLRRIAPGVAQLTPNRLGSDHLGAKLAVLAGHADQALLTAPGFDPVPVQRVLMAEAGRTRPGAFAWDGAERVEARLLGWSVHGDEPRCDGGPPAIGDCLRALPPRMRLAGLLCLSFEEDFAAIDGETTQIGWLAVCLPSHWSPAEKIGRHFAQVHAPVADNRMLISASAHLARLVSGQERWERFVWTITARPELDAHPNRTRTARWAAEASPKELAESAFFRTEHQTFVPVATRPRQAAFTIRVAVQALTDIAHCPARAARLHDALASMSPAVLDYRGLSEARDRLLQWLQVRAE